MSSSRNTILPILPHSSFLGRKGRTVWLVEHFLENLHRPAVVIIFVQSGYRDGSHHPNTFDNDRKCTTSHINANPVILSRLTGANSLRHEQTALQKAIHQVVLSGNPEIIVRRRTFHVVDEEGESIADNGNGNGLSRLFCTFGQLQPYFQGGV